MRGLFCLFETISGVKIRFPIIRYFKFNCVVCVNVVSMTKSDKICEKPTHARCLPFGTVPSCMSFLYNPIGFRLKRNLFSRNYKYSFVVMRANVLISINLLNPAHITTEPKTLQHNYEELKAYWDGTYKAMHLVQSPFDLVMLPCCFKSREQTSCIGELKCVLIKCCK